MSKVSERDFALTHVHPLIPNVKMTDVDFSSERFLLENVAVQTFRSMILRSPFRLNRVSSNNVSCVYRGLNCLTSFLPFSPHGRCFEPALHSAFLFVILRMSLKIVFNCCDSKVLLVESEVEKLEPEVSFCSCILFYCLKPA